MAGDMRDGGLPVYGWQGDVDCIVGDEASASSSVVAWKRRT